MPYIAHIGVVLRKDATAYEKGKWNYIKTIENIEYRWRINQNLLYEVVAGVYCDKFEALRTAKKMYVTVLYSLLREQIPIFEAGCDSYEQRFYHAEEDGDYDEFIKNEKFFFWDSHFLGGQIGPGVYEVNESLDDFNSYKFLSVSLQVSFPDTNLALNNVTDYLFTYSREAQTALSTIVVADSIPDYGMQMNLYCGLLEHLATNFEKEECIISEINMLTEHVRTSALSKDQKDQLINFLESGKKTSSRQKCIKLIKQYGKNFYGKFAAKKVFEEAYSIRSAFAHGDERKDEKSQASHYMKYLVLDVLCAVFIEKENPPE